MALRILSPLPSKSVAGHCQAEETRIEPAPEVTRGEAEDMKKGIPSTSAASENAESSDDKLYNDIVKQFGEDSPQAQAARRQLQVPGQ